MTITERTLKRWRKDALEHINSAKSMNIKISKESRETNMPLAMSERILRLTQILLDQALLKSERK